jgi:hypothetical protein
MLDGTITITPVRSAADKWFRFRVWIKDFLKRLFTGQLDQPPAVPIYHDLHVDDRGHSNEHPGYLR